MKFGCSLGHVVSAHSAGWGWNYCWHEFVWPLIFITLQSHTRGKQEAT